MFNYSTTPVNLQKDKFETEAELASQILTRLELEGWDCYPEVTCNLFSQRADIVAVREGKTLIIETKLNLSFDVISQALRWLSWGIYVVIAIPEPKNKHSERFRFIKEFLELKGIGLWFVATTNKYCCSNYVRYYNDSFNRRAFSKNYSSTCIEECLKAKPFKHNLKKSRELISKLDVRMKQAQAGGVTSTSGFKTPFRLTLDELEAYVKTNSGCSLKEAINKIPHHYSSEISAKSCLSSLIHLAKNIESRTELNLSTNRKELFLYYKNDIR